MFTDASDFVNSLFNNPVRATATGLLILFVYLYIAKRKENETLRAKLKEEKQIFYVELFIFLNRVVRNQADLEKPEEMQKLIELDSKLKLFSGDKVVMAWADFWRSIFLSSKTPNDIPTMLEGYGYLQWALRKDIGSSGFWSGLKWYDFSRSSVNNLDDYLPPQEQTYRTAEMKKAARKK